MELIKKNEASKAIFAGLSLVSLCTLTLSVPFALKVFGISYYTTTGIAQWIFSNFWWLSLSADLVSIICMCTGVGVGVGAVIRGLIKGTLKITIKKGWKAFLQAVWA